MIRGSFTGKGRFCGLSLLLLALSSCATAPPARLVPLISDMGAISLSHYNGSYLTWTSTYSFLPGKKQHFAFEEFTRPCSTLGDLTLHSTGSVDDELRMSLSTRSCAAWQEIAQHFGKPTALKEFDVYLVPEGAEFRLPSTDIGFPKFRLSLAVRHYTSKPQGFMERHLVRTLAHELYHLHAAHLLGAEHDSEQTAYVIESCVELAVIGSTFGDLTGARDNLEMLDAIDAPNSSVATSVSSAISANSFVSSFTAGKLLRDTDGKGREFLAVCDALIPRSDPRN